MGERNLNTPLMKQYVQFKAQYPQAVLLMRVGDFYEAYGDDAIAPDTRLLYATSWKTRR